MIQIKFTEGCPNHCEYCYSDKYEPMQLELHDIWPRWPQKGEDVRIMDYNFLGVITDPAYTLCQLPKARYEFVQGIDYRYLTPKIAFLLKQKNFHKLRWAWDYQLSLQMKHKDVLQMLTRAGFRPKDLSVFILVNWKIPFVDCVAKLNLLKVWNVCVADCCYDGGYPKSEIDYNTNPRFNGKRFWKYQDLKKFRHECRVHNQLVKFGIYPELKR